MAAPSFDRIDVVAGTTPHVAQSFVWDDDGSARDVSASVVTLHVFTDSSGRTLLFPIRTGVTTTPTNQAVFGLLSTDLTVPGVYYAEVWLTTGGDVQKWIGTLGVSGITVVNPSVPIVVGVVTQVNAEIVVSNAVGGETILALMHIPLAGSMQLFRNGNLELGFTLTPGSPSVTMTAPLLAGDKVVSFYAF